MIETGRETLNAFLGTAHRSRKVPALPSSWRDSVMADVRRTDRNASTDDLERLAPRFALTAAAVLIVCVMAGTWALGTLPSDIRSSYTTAEFTVIRQPWQNL